VEFIGQKKNSLLAEKVFI